MNTLINVARYHLAKRVDYLVLPWVWLAFAFTVDIVIFAMIPIGHHSVLTAHGLVQVQVQDNSPRDAGGLGAIIAIFFVLGIQSVAKSLPFALAIGVSRRSYYAGTALLAVTLAFCYGLVITVLQAIERATSGWGVQTHIFRVPYILSGPWYQTWLTMFVALTLLFGYGMWFGIVFRRWSLTGSLAFSAAQVTVLVAAALMITWSHSWRGTGHFFTTLSGIGLTGVLAALAAALLAGGYATIRRVAI
jgi:hypothetical protein